MVLYAPRKVTFRRTSRRPSACRPALRQGFPTANIASTCCSARFRRRGPQVAPARRPKASRSSFGRSTGSPFRSSSASAISRPRQRSPMSARSRMDGKPAISLDISRTGSTLDLRRNPRVQGRRRKADRDRCRHRRLYRSWTAVGDRPDRSRASGQRHRPGHGAICRADRHRAGDHRRNQRGPALEPGGRRGRGASFDAAVNPLDARRFCARGAGLGRRRCRVGGLADWTWPGPPTRRNSFFSTSIFASCGLATGCAPTGRQRAPASCSATSSPRSTCR